MEPQLERDDRGLALVGGGMKLQPDFTDELPRLAHGRLQHELLVRAAKVKGHGRPVAIDACAGLGEDALLLAAAGFEVFLYEKDPVIAALLQDALRRAADDPRLADVVERMHAQEWDGIAALHAIGNEIPEAPSPIGKRLHAENQPASSRTSFQTPPAPDVVYLDPMFPERKKSAAVKKKFQLLHQLERPCEDETELLDVSLSAHPRKVVVKRPAKGPWLADRKPSYFLTGKSVRYDVYVRASQNQ